MWVFWRTKSGRRWIWEALIRLDVGAPMVFVRGDIQYVKWRKFDQVHGGFFCVSPALGNFCRLQPVGGHGCNCGSGSI